MSFAKSSQTKYKGNSRITRQLMLVVLLKVLLVLVVLLLVACEGSGVSLEAPTPVPAQAVATNSGLTHLETMSPPSQTQQPVSEFTLLGSNVISSTIDTIVDTNIMGIYKYNGAKYLRAPFINVVVSDANGSDLAAKQALTRPGLVAPGSLIPFRASFSTLFDNLPDNLDNLEFTISAEEADSQWLSWHSTDFEVTNTSMTSGTASEPLRVLGTVINRGENDASDIEVLAVLYDEQGEIVGVESTIVASFLDSAEFVYDEQGNLTGIASTTPFGSSDLPPGASKPFSIEFYGVARAARFDIVVDGEM